MESLVSYIGLAGSAASMLTTMYFWMVRVRKEQPCLKPYLADKETFLGLSRDGIRQIGLKIGFIVVNYSVLPNVILGARVSVRLKDDWQEVGNLAFDKQSQQPFNLTPLQAALLRLTGSLTFTYTDALEGSSSSATKYLDAFVADPWQIKLELQHLNKRVDIYVLNGTADKGNGARGIRPLPNAA